MVIQVRTNRPRRADDIPVIVLAGITPTGYELWWDRWVPERGWEGPYRGLN